MAFSAETFARQCTECLAHVDRNTAYIGLFPEEEAMRAIATRLMPFFCLIEHQLNVLTPEGYMQWLKQYPALYSKCMALQDVVAANARRFTMIHSEEAAWRLAHLDAAIRALLALCFLAPNENQAETCLIIKRDDFNNIPLLLQNIDRHEVIRQMTNEILDQFVSYIPTVLEYCAKLQLQV